MTPIPELERQLEQLNQTLTQLPKFERGKKRPLKTFSANISGMLSTFEDQLESLRLEANLLQSEDSPFTQRRRLKESERAQKLAEARAFAEAQFERLTREKELAELKARREEAERQAQELIKENAKESQARSPKTQVQSLKVDSLENSKQEASLLPQESLSLGGDWDASVEYTIMGETPNLEFEQDSSLSIAPDDSIFLDLPSTPPEPAFDSVSQIKNSLPPRPASQVSIPPQVQSIVTEQVTQKLLISLLKGLLPAKPRQSHAHQSYVGAGQQSDLNILKTLPWMSVVPEISWQEFDFEDLEASLEGLESLSLAPRAFRPAAPLATRTISLRLKSTEDRIAQLDPLVSEDDEFNLSDFEEQKDPELHEMHQTYRALEEQVGEMAFYAPEHVKDEPRFDLEHSSKSQHSFEPSFDGEQLSNTGEEDAFDEGPDLATLDPALPSVDDPFEMLEDLSFDQERLTSDFDWEGDTPTNIFGNEPTPTNVYGDESQVKSKQPVDEEDHQSSNKGIFSRFFGRNK